MIRDDLVRRLAARMEINLGEADRIVQAFTWAIISGAREEGKVVIQGFCSFTVKDVPARVSPNPNNGEPLHIPAKRKVRFRPGKDLRAVVNNGNLR